MNRCQEKTRIVFDFMPNCYSKALFQAVLACIARNAPAFAATGGYCPDLIVMLDGIFFEDDRFSGSAPSHSEESDAAVFQALSALLQARPKEHRWNEPLPGFLLRAEPDNPALLAVVPSGNIQAFQHLLNGGIIRHWCTSLRRPQLDAQESETLRSAIYDAVLAACQLPWDTLLCSLLQLDPGQYELIDKAYACGLIMALDSSLYEDPTRENIPELQPILCWLAEWKVKYGGVVHSPRCLSLATADRPFHLPCPVADGELGFQRRSTDEISHVDEETRNDGRPSAGTEQIRCTEQSPVEGTANRSD